MEVNDTELEEGEASCYYKDDDENFDPDVDLAYLVRASLWHSVQIFHWSFA